MKTNFKSIVIIILLLLFLYLYLINSVFMMNHFIDYSILFLTKMVPVCFPFMILSSLLLQYGIISYIPLGEYFGLFFLSLLSGFPNGTKFIHDLVKEKAISIEMGNKMLLYSHFPNPLFLFGTVYLSLENHLALTVRLYSSVLLSNFIILLFVKKKEFRKISFQKTNDEFSKKLYNIILSTSKTILLIYGISMFFYLLLVILTKYISFSSYLFVFFCGVFDLTKGVVATTLIQSVINRAFFVLFFISFGGISIHMQVKSILSDTSLSYSSFVLGRIIATLLAFVVFFLLIH